MNKVVKPHTANLNELIEDIKLFVEGKYKKITLGSTQSVASVSCIMLSHYITPVAYITMIDYSGNETYRYIDTKIGGDRVAEYITYAADRVVSENTQMMAATGDHSQYEFSWEFIPVDKESTKSKPAQLHKE